MLTNLAYIGKKEVNKRGKGENQSKLPEAEKYKLVGAVWPGIVEEEKFFKVQKLLASNSRSKGNGAKAIKHSYVLNSGLLWCGACGQEMEGRSGTGRGSVRYYYYRCKSDSCGFKVPADEIEGLILHRLTELASREDIMAELVAAANRRLQEELPQLLEQKGLVEKELNEVRSTADSLLSRLTALAGSDGVVFIKESLDNLAARRRELENGYASLETAIGQVEKQVLNSNGIRAALVKMEEVFSSLPPHQQKELVRLVLHKAILAEGEMKIALYGRPPKRERYMEAGQGDRSRFEPLVWLPTSMAQSVLRDIFLVQLPSITRRCSRESASRLAQGAACLAFEWERKLASGQVKNRAELARREGVSRARVTQVLGAWA